MLIKSCNDFINALRLAAQKVLNSGKRIEMFDNFKKMMYLKRYFETLIVSIIKRFHMLIPLSGIIKWDKSMKRKGIVDYRYIANGPH
jgi:hypothetical protein